MTVVTRFAPSPTGNLHIGTVRTALFSWLYARKHKGSFLLRIEDTDRLRSTPEATQLIFDTLDWLGLNIDEPPVYQSQRFTAYDRVATRLIDEGNAYYCDCSSERLEKLREEQQAKGLKPRYDNKCRDRQLSRSKDNPVVIRFKSPLDGEVRVKDMVQGEVAYKNSELDDLIIVRSDGSPTYNFSVVVDEIEMGVTHVIRGDDHLNNTPRQINLFQALGAKLPQFGHVPMILSSSGKKISKREGASGALDLRKQGYLPEAVLNYLVRLGWSHGDQEIFSVEEMIELFDVVSINRSPAKLDEKKLEWLNHQYMMAGDAPRICELAKPFFQNAGIDTEDTGPSLIDLFEVMKQRSRTLVQFAESSEFFFKELAEYDEKATSKYLTSEAGIVLKELRSRLNELPEWTSTRIHEIFQAIVDEHEIKFGDIAQPARVALTGRTVSPGIDVTMELLGREQALTRIEYAIQWIQDKKHA